MELLATNLSESRYGFSPNKMHLQMSFVNGGNVILMGWWSWKFMDEYFRGICKYFVILSSWIDVMYHFFAPKVYIHGIPNAGHASSREHKLSNNISTHSIKAHIVLQLYCSYLIQRGRQSIFTKHLNMLRHLRYNVSICESVRGEI